MSYQAHARTNPTHTPKAKSPQSISCRPRSDEISEGVAGNISGIAAIVGGDALQRLNHALVVVHGLDDERGVGLSPRRVVLIHLGRMQSRPRNEPIGRARIWSAVIRPQANDPHTVVALTIILNFPRRRRVLRHFQIQTVVEQLAVSARHKTSSTGRSLHRAWATRCTRRGLPSPRTRPETIGRDRPGRACPRSAGSCRTDPDASCRSQTWRSG